LRYLRYPPAGHPGPVPRVLPSAAHTAHGIAMILAAKTVPQVIDSTTAWIVGILAGLATLMLTVGGVRYLMAGGDPAEVQKAKIALRSAAIGYGLAVLAPVVVAILQSLTGS
jgi:Type IV secretion system pilin